MLCGPERATGPVPAQCLCCWGKARCLSSCLFINEMSAPSRAPCVYTVAGVGDLDSGGSTHVEVVP